MGPPGSFLSGELKTPLGIWAINVGVFLRDAYQNKFLDINLPYPS
jgi:hypothetical protein